MSRRPVVAVVGRPNVGKSTLLNRIVGRREAIVEERPGVTRDRMAIDTEWRGRPLTVVDTGGWVAADDGIDAQVSRQSERAIADADLVVLVTDVTTGVTADDDRVADLLRRKGVPTLLVVNKVDDTSRETDMWAFLALGLGEPLGVSALHGRGSGDMLDAVLERLDAADADRGAEGTGVGEGDDEIDVSLSVAIVGRPNVGKSTLFNRLIGDERSVVHDMAGTTRDAIDTVVRTDEGLVRFIDTAGMRRRAKVDEATEYYSQIRALRAIDTADVALLVIDTMIGVTAQDQRLAERVAGAGCPVVVLLNKWDLADEETKDGIGESIVRRLHFIGEAPVLKISAHTGRGVQRVLPALFAAGDAYDRRIPTAKVNAALRDAQSRQPAPAGARVLYATQGAAQPPTFTLFATKRLPPTYVRYLEGALREAFDLGRTPIKMRVRVRD